MRSLFLKVFLWFWLTFILFSTCTTVLTLYARSGPVFSALRGALSENLLLPGREALYEYETNGPKALNAYLERLRASSVSEWYFVVDPQGEPAGSPLPPEVMEPVERAFQSARLVMDHGIGEFVVALPLTDASGKKYVIVRRSPRGILENAFSRDRASFLGKAALAALITCVLSLVAARHITQPIVKLRKTINRFARGDFSVRSKGELGNRKDEIAAMGDDFDRMADRIQALMAAQTRLLRDISHELRSPLARLGIALDLIEDNPSQDNARYVQQIRKESERMHSLTSRLITLVRLEGESPLSKGTEVDLSALLRRVCETNALEARHKECEIQCAGEEGVKVAGDEELLFSAVENVVRNAVHHSPAHTDVSVSLETTQQDGLPWAVIRVRDHGPGVPEELLDDLFKPFFRVDDSRDRRSGGTGLGLAIAHDAVHRHKGTIRCSNAPDGGLQVRIALPVA